MPHSQVCVKWWEVVWGFAGGKGMEMGRLVCGVYEGGLYALEKVASPLLYHPFLPSPAPGSE